MTITPQKQQSEDFAERGWRMEMIPNPDGTTDFIYIPLTEEEFLHPKEGYRLPNSTFHDNAIADARDILIRRYAADSQTGVFSDLIVKWDIEDLDDHCPDVFVAFGIRNKEQNRTEFVVTKEGVRPDLIIEVVSPRYRKADRQTKVKEYAQARVQEYVIIDRRTQRGQVIDEVLGYRLVEGQYLPLTPDDEGRICCETVGLLIGLVDGKILMVDAETGERLLTSVELEQKVTEAEARAIEAETRAAKLAELLRAQGINPDEV
jgi:Uma2 family endonuclease